MVSAAPENHMKAQPVLAWFSEAQEAAWEHLSSHRLSSLRKLWKECDILSKTVIVRCWWMLCSPNIVACHLWHSCHRFIIIVLVYSIFSQINKNHWSHWWLTTVLQLFPLSVDVHPQGLTNVVISIFFKCWKINLKSYIFSLSPDIQFNHFTARFAILYLCLIATAVRVEPLCFCSSFLLLFAQNPHAGVLT